MWYLLSVFLLDLLQVSSKVHADLVFGAQQGTQHSVSRHADPTQGWPLELAPQVKQFLAQVFKLQKERGDGEREGNDVVKWTHSRGRIDWRTHKCI